jgi:hypothetical protein
VLLEFVAFLLAGGGCHQDWSEKAFPPAADTTLMKLQEKKT